MIRITVSFIMLVMMMLAARSCIHAPSAPLQPVHCSGSDAANRWCYHV